MSYISDMYVNLRCHCGGVLKLIIVNGKRLIIQSVFQNCTSPTHGIVWVARAYPLWQRTVLNTLISVYEVCVWCLLFCCGNV